MRSPGPTRKDTGSSRTREPARNSTWEAEITGPYYARRAGRLWRAVDLDVASLLSVAIAHSVARQGGHARKRGAEAGNDEVTTVPPCLRRLASGRARPAARRRRQ